MLKEEEISIKDITIREVKTVMSSVQVELTNGVESPYFQNDKLLSDKLWPYRLQITEDVFRLQLKCSHLVSGLRLAGRKNEDICKSKCYQSWENEAYYWREQQVPEGHKVIGVYGYVPPDSPYIRNFGFITVAYK